MGGFILFLIVAGLVACLVWQFLETRKAEATTAVASAYAPADAARIVREAFGGPRVVLWTSVGGPGAINMRRRGIRGGITLSIDIEPGAHGGSRVEMWASQTVTYLIVLINFAGVVNRRRNAIERALTEGVRAGLR